MTLNVLGAELEPCSYDPLTGFYRDGCCHTGTQDTGAHIVCAEMTQEFLEFSRSVGNDLSTPQPQFQFPGLAVGDRWCLSASRWQEALEAGVAPPVVLASTQMLAIEWVSRGDLLKHGLDQPAQIDQPTQLDHPAQLDHGNTFSEDLDDLTKDIKDIANELQDLKRDLGRLGQELYEEFDDPDEETPDYLR